jgi:predicted transcriptional regulator
VADTTIKQRALDAVKQLPEDASWEDVMERLLFVEKVERGIAEADAGKFIPHEHVKARYGL